MTDDIVARLREAADSLSEIYPDYAEAADEIVRLRADLDAYQKERDEEVVRLRVELAKERERADAHYRVLECVISKRDELRALLLDAYNTWGEWPQETLARIAAALKGDNRE